MVAPAIPLIYWGIAILVAGGAAITARKLQEEEIGKVELPDSISDLFKPKPEPEPEPEEDYRPPPMPPPFDPDTETRTRRRCEDDPEQDCDFCKPAVEGRSTLPMHMFQAGTVRNPSPRARGALYQHYVAPWHKFVATEEGGRLVVQIEEWNWRRGNDGSWDALVFSECKLLDCKLGYRDYLDDAGPDYKKVNPIKPFLGTLQDAFQGQLLAQYAAFISDWPAVSLDWIFSDSEVRWQFIALKTVLGLHQIDARHVPFSYAPDGTQFVRELYSGSSPDTYGYWEDN